MSMGNSHDEPTAAIDYGAIRSEAVRIVDARYGYTVEWSNQPTVHSLEYDEEERRLIAEAESHA